MKILVAEDERVTRMVLVTRLRQLGHEVIEAEDGSSAWNLFHADEPDLVISDWMMPGKTGVELCRAIRSLDRKRYAYVILVTLLSDRKHYAEGMEAGADDFLSKPVDMTELSARLAVARRILDLHNEAVRHGAELEQALSELRTAQHALVQAEKLASLGQLIAGIAHEINNPLAFVRSNVNRFGEYFDDLLMLAGRWDEFGKKAAAVPSLHADLAAVRADEERTDIPFLSEDFPTLMEHTTDGLKRISTIVTQLRGFAHMGGDESAEASINDVLDETLTLVWNELKHRGRIEKEYGDVPPLYCNAGEIKQVLVNLIVNAAHAIGEKGVITLRTSSQGDALRIDVSDTGCGIPENIRNRIFDPFFTTKPVGKGTGLGLWVSSSIVTKHGGRIEVKSEPGAGSTFSIILPYTHAAGQTAIAEVARG